MKKKYSAAVVNGTAQLGALNAPLSKSQGADPRSFWIFGGYTLNKNLIDRHVLLMRLWSYASEFCL